MIYDDFSSGSHVPRLKKVSTDVHLKLVVVVPEKKKIGNTNLFMMVFELKTWGVLGY